MLEINRLQQTNEGLIYEPLKFSLSQLKNGNFVLTDLSDHFRLKSVLSDWQKKRKKIQKLEQKYKKFLENNLKVVEIENATFWKDIPNEGDLNADLDSISYDSKTCKSFSQASGINNKEDLNGNILSLPLLMLSCLMFFTT